MKKHIKSFKDCTVQIKHLVYCSVQGGSTLLYIKLSVNSMPYDAVCVPANVNSVFNARFLRVRSRSSVV